MFVAIFSRVFLGERCGLFNIFTICVTLLGIIFIVKPPSLFDSEDDAEEKQKSNYFLGPIAALASAIFTSSAMILIRVLKGLLCFWFKNTDLLSYEIFRSPSFGCNL